MGHSVTQVSPATIAIQVNLFPATWALAPIKPPSVALLDPRLALQRRYSICIQTAPSVEVQVKPVMHYTVLQRISSSFPPAWLHPSPCPLTPVPPAAQGLSTPTPTCRSHAAMPASLLLLPQGLRLLLCPLFPLLCTAPLGAAARVAAQPQRPREPSYTVTSHPPAHSTALILGT